MTTAGKPSSSWKLLGSVLWALTKITVPVAALMGMVFFMVSEMHGTALAAYGGVYGGFILFLIGYWIRTDYNWKKRGYEREQKWNQEKEQFKRASYDAARKCGYSARANSQSDRSSSSPIAGSFLARNTSTHG